MGDRAVEAAEAPTGARVEPVRDRDEGAAARARRRQCYAEVAGREPRDVEVGSRVRAAGIGGDAREAAALVVLDRAVGGRADALHVVGDAVAVIVVQRRCVAPEHDVVDDGTGRRERAGGRRVVVEHPQRVRDDVFDVAAGGRVRRPRPEGRVCGGRRAEEHRRHRQYHAESSHRADGRPGRSQRPHSPPTAAHTHHEHVRLGSRR